MIGGGNDNVRKKSETLYKLKKKINMPAAVGLAVALVGGGADA